MFLLCACSEKKSTEIKKTETLEENSIITIEKIPEFLYVNSKEGLRVRDESILSGNRIYLLPHKDLVTVVKRNDVPVEIDGVTDYWYLITTNETTGWVFGGYLCSSLEKIDNWELLGKYSFFSIDMLKGRLDELPGKIDEYYCEIEYVDYNNFLLKTNIPFLLSSFDRNKNDMQFKFPPDEIYWFPDFIAGYEGTPFYQYSGEKRGGGTYIYLYYDQEQIIIDYLKYNDINSYLEEWEPKADIYWLEFKIILKKQNAK
jgi:hypothetical protein